MKKAYLSLIIVLFLFTDAVSGQFPVLSITDADKDTITSLVSYSQVWEDVSEQKTLQEILHPTVQAQFAPLDIEKVNIYAKSFWLKITVHNLTNRTIKVGLQFGNFENLTIYAVTANDTQKVAQRLFKRLESVEYIHLAPQYTTLYFHVERSQAIYSGQVQEALVMMSLHGEQYEYFWETKKNAFRYFSLFFGGAMSIMFFYNTILFFILHDRNYLFYILGLLFFTIADVVERGVYEELVSPEPPVYFLWLLLICVILYVICQLLFTRSFLNLPKFMPIANKVLLVMLGIVLGNFAFIILGQYRYFHIYMSISCGLANVVIMVISVLAVAKVRSNITYYLLGNIFYTTGIIIYVLDLLRFIPSNFFTVNALLFGSLLEISLFSLALADKINDARRALAEQKLRQIQEREELIEKQNKELTEQVATRTKELLQANDKLEQHNEEISLQKEALDRSNRTKDKLFSIIAHDLRSPLSALSASLDLLDMDLLTSEELTMMTASLKKSLNAINVTLDDLLQWAKSQMDGRESKKETVPIHALSNDKIMFFLQIMEKKKVSLLNHVPPNTFVYADLNQMRAIFRNLIANAIKFTPENGVISISAKKSEQSTTIAISDTGIGMSSEQINKLFVTNTHFTTRGISGEKGTGLGLLLCKDFVEQNGGKIWVESEVGKGSTFYFTLPSN